MLDRYILSLGMGDVGRTSQKCHVKKWPPLATTTTTPRINMANQQLGYGLSEASYA